VILLSECYQELKKSGLTYLFGRMLGSSCKIDSCIYHFCGFLLELTWRYCPLFRVANHFFRGTPQNAVTDFVAVLPKNSIEKLFVSMDLIDQLRQGLVG